ncbi:alkaline phosphatase [Planctomycetota bacterium]
MKHANFTKKLILLSIACFIFLLTATSAYSAVKVDKTDLAFYQRAAKIESYPLISGKNVRNVILFIGDGMGLNHTTFARFKTVGPTWRLHTERMPIVGLVGTYSNNALVTDSAASGTALATGFKTDNGVVSQLADGREVMTILEAAKSKGMATGLVVTSTITHATPACFAAHVKKRGFQQQIAEQIIENKVNVLLGGGRKFFIPKSKPNSARKDNRDLIKEAIAAGYSYIETTEQLNSADNPYLLGLFNIDALTTQEPEPTLAQLTEKAIEILSKKKKGLFAENKGFFLMVEGSQIDWAAHENNPDYCLRQTILFDQAVKSAIDFALKDRHTLVIVTADHETGGLVVKGGDLQGEKLDLNWATGGHTPSLVPLYAFGPQAQTFAGVYDNTDVPKRIAKALEIKNFPKIIEKSRL